MRQSEVKIGILLGLAATLILGDWTTRICRWCGHPLNPVVQGTHLKHQWELTR